MISVCSDAFFRPSQHPADVYTHLGVLVNTIDPSAIDRPTTVPVPAVSTFPFLGKTAWDLWNFAQQKIKPPIFNRALAILDNRTVEDRATCLLVTTWENPPKGQESQLLKVRSDFYSALSALNAKNLGIGGDEHFRGGVDGVVRRGDGRA